MSSYAEEQLQKFEEELESLYSVRELIYNEKPMTSFMAIPGTERPVAFMPVTTQTAGYMVPLGGDYLADVNREHAILLLNRKIDSISDKMSALSSMLPPRQTFDDIESSEENMTSTSEVVDLELPGDLPALENAEVFLDLTTADRDEILDKLESLQSEDPTLSDEALDNLYFKMCQEKLDKKKEEEERRANSIVGTVKLNVDLSHRPTTKPQSKEKKMSLFKQRLAQDRE